MNVIKIIRIKSYLLQFKKQLLITDMPFISKLNRQKTTNNMVKINNLFWVLIMLLNVVVSHAEGKTYSSSNTMATFTARRLAWFKICILASSNLILLLKDGSSNTFDLPSVRKIYFDSSSSVKENKTENLAISPNPASNTLQIQGIPQGVTSFTFIGRWAPGL